MRRGFTLVELSIVLALIGLLVGGVMAGQSLLRSSQVNALAADATRIRQAFGLFKEKYRALPGDFSGATTIWGEAAASCTNTASTSAATCNGNGDGSIGAVTSLTVTATAYEILRAWQHMANAGLVEGNYTGGPTVAGQALSGAVETNLPRTALSEASMMMLTLSITSGADTNYYQGIHEVLMVGKLNANATGTAGYTQYPLLTPTEAKSMDIKLDDGKPATGTITTLKTGSAVTPGCASATEYTVSSSTQLCALLFDLDATNQ